MAGKGGYREGAGRKPSDATVLRRARGEVKALTAALILSQINELQLWTDLLSATTSIPVGKGEDASVVEVPDNRIRIDALKYLTDRRDGKAAQSMNLKTEGRVILGGTPRLQAGKPN